MVGWFCLKYHVDCLLSFELVRVGCLCVSNNKSVRADSLRVVNDLAKPTMPCWIVLEKAFVIAQVERKLGRY